MHLLNLKILKFPVLIELKNVKFSLGKFTKFLPSGLLFKIAKPRNWTKLSLAVKKGWNIGLSNSNK